MEITRLYGDHSKRFLVLTSVGSTSSVQDLLNEHDLGYQNLQGSGKDLKVVWHPSLFLRSSWPGRCPLSVMAGKWAKNSEYVHDGEGEVWEEGRGLH